MSTKSELQQLIDDYRSTCSPGACIPESELEGFLVSIAAEAALEFIPEDTLETMTVAEACCYCHYHGFNGKGLG